MGESVEMKKVHIFVLAHQDLSAPIVISVEALAIATLAIMEEHASIIVMEQILLVFVQLVPLAKLANKTTEMSVPMILAKTEDVLIVLVITIALVNLNGGVKTAMSMTKPVLEEWTSPTDVISSSTFSKSNKSVFKTNVARRLVITVAIKNAILTFVAMTEMTVVKVLIPGRTATPHPAKSHVGMCSKMASAIRHATLKNAFLTVLIVMESD